MPAVPAVPAGRWRRLGGEKEVVALASVVAAVGLTALKLWVGLATGSLGVLAEALHSGLDLIAAAITYFAVVAAARPPDEEHPYGHGKFESVSALAETALLLVTSVWIAVEAVQRIRGGGHDVDATWQAFAVMGIAIAVDASRSTALYRTAKKYQSQALEADALHFSTDILSSAVVILGLVLTRFGRPMADSYAALGVAFFVAFLGVRLGKRAADTLTDRTPAGLADRVRAVIAGCEGVVRVRRLRARKVGPRLFVDADIDVDRLLPLEEAHKVAHRVEGAVKAKLGDADVLVHLKPVRRPEEPFLPVLQLVAQKDPRVRGVHLASVADIAGSRHATIELFVDPHRTVAEAHAIADAFEQVLLREAKDLGRVTTRIRVGATEAVWGADVTSEHPEVVRAVEAAAAEVTGVVGVKSVTVHRLEDELAATVECRLPPEETMLEAALIAELLEERVRRRAPEVDHVVVHVEP